MRSSMVFACVSGVALAIGISGAGKAAPAERADQSPGFRGDGTGLSPAKQLPLTWTPESVAWKMDLPGYGQSCPVVQGGKIFLTAVEGPNKETNLVVCLDADTGKQLWKKELPATQKMKSSIAVSRAAPTPVVDASGLYVFFESGELAAFDHSGKQLWLRSLVKEYGEFKNGHGLGGSPAQSADHLYLVIDHAGPSYLLAVEKKTGKNLYKVERKSRSSWTSPVLTRQNDKELLVISSGGSVDVYAAADGRLLSSYTEVGNNNVPSAVVQGDRVVVGASDPPRNANRELSLKSCCCLVLGQDGKLSEKAAWQSEKATASFASPLIYRDCVYYVNQAGVLFCLDLKTGKEHYSERATSCWASPAAAGDRVYLFGRDGTTVVVKAGPKLERLATNKLWSDRPADKKPGEKKSDEKKDDKTDTPRRGGGMAGAFGDPILYGVALVDGAIYLRTGTALYAIKTK